jgi:hypothetical protein
LPTCVHSKVVHRLRHETTPVSVDKSVDKKNVIHTWGGILFSLKKALMTLSEISQS